MAREGRKAKTVQLSLDLDDDPHLRARGGMTVAQHRRYVVEQLIRHEEASGDPELIATAAWRRQCNNMLERRA